MKELDFDELDRAVNTLMGGVSSSMQAPKSVDDGVKTITIPSTLTSNATPVMPTFPTSGAATTVESTSVPIAASQPETAVVVDRQSTLSVATRRSGRFMDVVHPSSDMKNPSNDRQPIPTRTAPMLQPIVSPQATPVADETPIEPSELIADETPELFEFAESAIEPATSTESVFTEQSTSASDVSSEWPDPLAGFSVEEPVIVASAVVKPAVVEAEAPAPEAHTETDDEDDEDEDLFAIDTEEPVEEPEPQTSPFLADAKVQKRPLGSAASEDIDMVNDNTLEQDPLTQSNPEAQLPANAVPHETPLPAELQSDLMAVESDETVAVGSTVEQATTTPAQSTPAPTGPTSIQQQYTEAKTSGDQTNGSIYDTDAYHQPLAHPVKKKSGWMWIIWVVIILLVGAGGGAALYLSGII